MHKWRKIEKKNRKISTERSYILCSYNHFPFWLGIWPHQQINTDNIFILCSTDPSLLSAFCIDLCASKFIFFFLWFVKEKYGEMANLHLNVIVKFTLPWKKIKFYFLNSRFELGKGQDWDKIFRDSRIESISNQIPSLIWKIFFSRGYLVDTTHLRSFSYKNLNKIF